MTDSPPTVLIVDDEEDVAEVYAYGLSEEYAVRTAYDGREALEKTDDSVDVVLLDRVMDGMSGGDVLEEIRNRELDVRVAMVTAVDPDFDVAEMAFDAYVTKPVDSDELRETVEDLLALSHHDDRSRERVRVEKKKSALEQSKTEAELARNETYATLRERQAELEDEPTARTGR